MVFRLGKSRLYFQGIGLTCVLSALWLAGCDKGKGTEAGSSQMGVPVTITQVVVRDVPYYIDEIGRCSAKESVSIMPQVSGKIEAAHFVEGDDVKKSDLLFTIDKRPFEAVLAQATAAKLQASENLKLAEQEFARLDALKGNAVSQTEYDQKKSAVAVAKAQENAAQAAIETAKLNVEYCEIRSPLTGRLGMRLVDPGNVVKLNETALVSIQSLDPINVDFTIAEDRLPEVRENMANGRLKTLVRVPTAATTQPAARDGELAMIDNSVQDNSGTLRLRAHVPNKDRYFWPGQFVRVRLVLYEKKDALLIPTSAVQIGQQGTFVYVVKHDTEKKLDVAEMRPVTQGQTQGDLVVIEKGLNPGDNVILTGQLMVIPGAPVTVTDPSKNNPQVAQGSSEAKS